MSFAYFTNSENKSIIWGLLQEGGIFNDIPNSYFENIKRQFEMSILSMKPEFDVFFDKNDEGDEDYEKKASEMIMNSNKAVIKKMINELGKFKRPQQRLQQAPQQQPPSQVQPLLSSALPIPPRFDMTPNSSKMIGAIDARGSGKKQKIEEIYRADDLQKHRMSELEIRLKEKQEEMDTMLNTKKPTNIDFSDNGINDNKLASDEMEKLLAQALSSRQRELEQLVVNTSKDSNLNAEEWISGSNDPVTNALNASIAIKRSHNIKRPSEQSSQTSTTGTTGTTSKKNVSFNEGNNEEIVYDKDVTNRAGEDTATTVKNEHDNVSFFSKLKRTNNSTNEVSNVSNVSHTFYDNTIPLDDFMTEYDDEGEGCRVDDTNIHFTVLEKTIDAIDSREYAKLDEKINKMQNYIETIKETQDRILELLSQK
jgi:hypothetical protein